MRKRLHVRQKAGENHNDGSHVPSVTMTESPDMSIVSLNPFKTQCKERDFVKDTTAEKRSEYRPGREQRATHRAGVTIRSNVANGSHVRSVWLSTVKHAKLAPRVILPYMMLGICVSTKFPASERALWIWVAPVWVTPLTRSDLAEVKGMFAPAVLLCPATISFEDSIPWLPKSSPDAVVNYAAKQLWAQGTSVPLNVLTFIMRKPSLIALSLKSYNNPNEMTTNIKIKTWDASGKRVESVEILILVNT